MGERIKMCRTRLGMTQQELADAVGISRNSLSRIETAVVPNLTVYTAMRIAKALGISMDFLVYGECYQMCTKLLNLLAVLVYGECDTEIMEVNYGSSDRRNRNPHSINHLRDMVRRDGTADAD